MEHWEGVAALCVNPRDEKLLMVLQGKPGQPPCWTLPGGLLRERESPEQAVLREVHEETGLVTTIQRLFRKQQDKTEDFRRQVYPFTSHYFELETTSETLRPQDPDQQTYRAEWISKEQFEVLGLLYEYQRDVIQAFWSEVAQRAT